MKKDIDPEHNQGMEVVPQILTNQPDDFISIVKQLKQYGYDEVNLNLGCPSGTVVAKGKGSGFLSFPEKLDAFLDEIYSGAKGEHTVEIVIDTEGKENSDFMLISVITANK